MPGILLNAMNIDLNTSISDLEKSQSRRVDKTYQATNYDPAQERQQQSENQMHREALKKVSHRDKTWTWTLVAAGKSHLPFLLLICFWTIHL